MSYVRWKLINGYGPYAYEVKSVREGDKVRQEHIRYLGRYPGRGTARDGGSPQDARPDTNQPSASAPNLSDEKQETRDEIEASERRAREITARNEAEREIADTSDAPADRKEALKRRRTEKAADELRKEKAKGQKSLDDYHEKELDASKRSHEKWSSQRKKEARETADRVGCSPIQADALNQRARRAGKSYDEVDWDQVQGKDLSYHERVDKLDNAIGTRTRTKGEAARGERDFESTIRNWQRDPDRYQADMEAASREYFYDLKAEAY